MPRHQRSLPCTALVLCLFFIGSNLSLGQPLFLSVTNFGARGDALAISASVISNSPTITCATNHFTSADVGKIVELFGAGAPTGPTNHEDLVATIVRVANAQTAILDRVCGLSTNEIGGLYGVNNAAAFQACLAGCSGTNTVVDIPPGQYLLISPQALDPAYVMPNMFATYPAVTIQKGGVTFAGAGPERTILLGCGAWQRKGEHAYRGSLSSGLI